MDMTIDQQLVLDEALVPHASRLRIGKSNFRLRSDITSRESTLQVVYDVLRLTPFYKAFLVTTFDELPFKEEILAFLRYLRHSGEIKKITDVKINKLHQPWRSFAVVINKCLSGKSTRYDSLWLSQAQILWGMYHKKNVDFAYLLWEDFVYQVDHKDAKKSNEIDYPRFSKVIINFFMTKDLSIPIRNKVNWHYVKDDQIFTTIKLVSRHQNTQQFGAMLSVELTNEDIRNSTAYKEYYAIALGAAPLKTKASVMKTRSSSDTTMPPPIAAGTRLSTSAKGKQPDKSSKAKGLYVLSKVALTEAEQIKLTTKRSLQQTHISQASGSGADEGTDLDNNGDDFVHPKLSTHDEEAKDEESFDHIVQTPSHVEDSDDESNDDESHGMNVGGDEGPDAEDDDEELYRDVNINLEGRDSSSVSSQFVTNMLNPSPDTIIDSLFESTHLVDVPVTTTVVPLLVTAPTLPPPSIPIISQVQQAPAPSPATAPKANFFEFMHTNQFAEAVSFIPSIIDRYIDHQMNEAVKVAVQLQSDRLRDEAQAKKEDFLNKLDDNIQKIIKEQVKEQVKTSYVVPADQSELELKKILIEKMESNKSIHRSDEQRNLYKAPVDAYECDKIILDTYRDTVTLKRRRDDEDKDKEPFAGSD
nr:hypothetical protein [Tanacetum cinerariifolium]